jgi:DNA repair protein RAD50
LKYATTGDQPPNTKGGAFVHDPNIANEKEVKAQVKLRFHAANGRRMLAIRNLSVTLKKTHGMTMKTLENILAVADSDVTKGGKVKFHVQEEHLVLTCLVRGAFFPQSVPRSTLRYLAY